MRNFLTTKVVTIVKYVKGWRRERRLVSSGCRQGNYRLGKYRYDFAQPVYGMKGKPQVVRFDPEEWLKPCVQAVHRIVFLSPNM